MALRASLQTCILHSGPVARPSPSGVIRVARPIYRSPTRAMATVGDKKLDKTTPDSAWKDILTAEEVRLGL